MKTLLSLLLGGALLAAGCDIWGTAARLASDGAVDDGWAGEEDGKPADATDGFDGDQASADTDGCVLGQDVFMAVKLADGYFSRPDRLLSGLFDRQPAFDLVVQDDQSEILMVLVNLRLEMSGSTFENSAKLSFGTYPVERAVAFDAGTSSQRDNSYDIAVMTMEDGTPPKQKLHVLKNSATSLAFSSFEGFPVVASEMYGSANLMAGRFNDDDAPDLLVNVAYQGSSNYLYLWSGDTFTLHSGNLALDPMEKYLVKDLDGDERDDLVFVELPDMANPQNPKWIKVALGGKTASDGFFALRQVASFSELVTRDLITADFNGDGFQDLALAVSASDNKTELRFFVGTNIGGVFEKFSESFSSYFVDTTAVRLQAADLDGDGKEELMAGDLNSAEVLVLRNTASNLSIAMKQVFAVKACADYGYRMKDMLAAPVDEDRWPDLIVACGTDSEGAIYFLFNTCGR